MLSSQFSWISTVVVCVFQFGCFALGRNVDITLTGPSFLVEPPNRKAFSNSTGTELECHADGNPPPTVTWTLLDGTPVSNVSGLRYVSSDGTLHFSAFRSEQFRPDIHTVGYQCKISNSIGTIVSRDVYVKAVLSVDYEVHVYDVFVIHGNTAVMKCHIPTFLEEYVSVSAWIRDDTLKIVPNSETDGKFWISPQGDLYVKDASFTDRGSTYRCQTHHSLTGKNKISLSSGKLIVTDPSGNIPPKIVESVSIIHSAINNVAFLPCVAHGSPFPTISWMRQLFSGVKQTIIDHRIKPVSHGLLITDVQESDAGMYFCQVNSSTWTTFKEMSFNVIVPLQVTVEPSKETLDVGQPLNLQCHIKGHPISSIIWMKNGKLVPKENVQFLNKMSMSSFHIAAIKAEDKGMYQCFAGNERNTVHSVAQISLGDFKPELKETFSESVNNAGASITLSCSAVGNPLPSITWMLDNTLVNITPDVHTDGRGGIRSLLHIKKAQKANGGLYMCEAHNRLGRARHFARVNIHGFLEARRVPPITGVAGGNVLLSCPVYGYPIDTVEWRKDSSLLPVTVRQKVFQNGTLLINSVRRNEDTGDYSCKASNVKGEVVNSIVHLAVMVPPKIQPFAFQDELLREGMRARLQCVVSEGDSPITIEWLKDSQPIGEEMGIIIRAMDEFSSILAIKMITPRHNGLYTCLARNAAGVASHSAQLSVNVRPKIQPFKFQDEHFSVGGNIATVCMLTEGDPPIAFIWRKDGLPIEFISGISIVPVKDFSSMLTVFSATSSHNGNYSCTATNSAASDVFTAELRVNVSPKIVPFTFGGDHYFAGVLARVSCVVYQGDLPLTLQWWKDGQQLVPDTGSVVHEIDDFTSVLTINNIQSKHSGNYTCVAKNAAAAVSHTAQLIVKVPPKIVPFSFQDEQLIKGMFVRVSCVVSRGDLPLNITWLKDDAVISSAYGLTIRNFDEYSSVLSVDHLTSQHNGNYTCLASNAAATATFTAPLVVNVPPHWINYPEQVISVVLKQSVVLHCEADGFPKPVITWMKDENDKLNGGTMQVFPNGTLKISSIREEHEGFYVCKASNGIGGGLDRIVHLKVYDPPSILDTLRTVTARVDESTELSCVVQGDLPLNVTWSVDDKLIGSSVHGRFKIKDNVAPDGLTSELSIRKVKKEDSGVFTCRAQNAYGEDRANFRIIVQSLPDSPVNVDVTDVGNQTLRITWKAPFDGNSEILKYILEFRKTGGISHNKTVRGDQNNIIVSGLQPSATYLLRMFSENRLGQSSGSDMIKAIIAGEAPSGAPHNVNVQGLDSQTVKVSWQPPPRDTWNGDIRGYYVGYRQASSADPYNFQLLEVPAGYDKGLSFTIPELQEFTRYAIVIQAFNDIGKGPLSAEVLVMTSEDVPSKPPSDVRCSAQSSNKIAVSWKPPPADAINGILRGHRVLYWPIDSWDGKQIGVVNSSLATATLENLDPFTNHSIQVVSYTFAGDGLPSKPVYCRTWEDVPGSPAEVRCVSSSTESVAVYWSAPQNVNGHIIHYTVYVEDPNIGQQTSHKVLGHLFHFEVEGLKRSLRYKLWVTASSVLGEGQSSTPVFCGPAASFVPAKCIMFGRMYKVVQGAKIVLPCPSVGIPPPDFMWMHGREQVNPHKRLQVLPDHSLQITQVQSEDAGNYTCQIKNDFGEDAVGHQIIVKVPPPPPTLSVIMATFNSVGLRWKLRMNGDSPILGFVLRFKPEFGSWDTVELQPYQESHTLRNLRCGSSYQMTLAAVNEVGMGEASAVLMVSTDGGAPVAPPTSQLIEESTNHATLHLDCWITNGCPILYYTVEYQARRAEGWTLVTKGVKPNQRMQIIPDLFPGTWYTLRMTAHSTAGTTVAEYDFATLIDDKVSDFKINDIKEISDVFTHMDLTLIGPIVACGLVIIVCLVVTCFWVRYRRRQQENENKDDIDQGTISRHGESNRNTLTTLRSSRGGQNLADSDEDISPYAMVHLSDFHHGTLRPSNRVPFAGPLNHPSSGWHQSQQVMAVPFHHEPTAPPMSETYGIGSVYPTGMLMGGPSKGVSQSQAYAQPHKKDKKNATGSLPSKLPDNGSKHSEAAALPPVQDGDYDPPPEFKWPFNKQ